MTLVGANAAPELSGLDPLPGACNYFIDSNAENWRTDVPQYAGVKYADVYRGIDMIFYGNQSDLEYDFKVAPGADPAAIRVLFDSPLSVDENGDLVIETGAGQIRQRKPFAYQEVNGAKHQIAARYVLKGRVVSFRVGGYDKSKPLIIDPVLSYSTYLGASGSETGWAIAVDSVGAAYIAGQTSSPNFPTTQEAFQKGSTGANDVFVIKLNPEGNALVYSTYIGGAGDDFGFGIAVDSAGAAYVTGQTGSPNFPTKPAMPFIDSVSAFVLKMNPAGNALVYSTFLGGRGIDTGKAIAVDSAGAAYVTGETLADDFPVFNAFQSRSQNSFCGFEALFICSDAFVAKMNPEGTALEYSTYLGGNRADAGTAIAVDSAGAAYVTGQTASANFPVTPDAFQTAIGGSSTGGGLGGDAFVTKLAPSGSSLVYSTYLGRSGDERGSGVAIDSAGNAYVAGTTDSLNFPTTQDAFQPSNGGSAAFKSTTGGGSFSALKNGLAAVNVKTLAIDPMNPSTIYAGAAAAGPFSSLGGGVFKSTDGGNSWIAASNGLNVREITAIAIDPDVPSTLYAGTHQGVFKSTDGGNSWISRSQGLMTFVNVNALVIDRKRPSTIYAGTGSITPPPLPPVGVGGGIFKSTNGGATWGPTGFNKKPSSIIVLSLAIDPQKTQTLYAGTNDGFYLGSKGGKKWKGPTLTDIQPSQGNGAISSIAIDPNDRSTIYAAFGSTSTFPSNNGGFFKSTDRGLTWARLVSGLNVAIPEAIAVDPRNSSTLYAGGRSQVLTTFNNPPSGALLKSTNGGESWITTELSDAPVNTVAIDPQNSSVYAGTFIGTDVFITKLDSLGSKLIYSTHLGGRGADLGFAIALDSVGAAYVTGHTASDRFPTVNAFQNSKGRQDFIGDAFVAAVNRDGNALLYSSYLGGNGIDEAFAIAVDSAGAAYVTGRNNSVNFPTVNPLQAAFFGSVFDAFITKVAPAENP
jgi:photosystem II stability/assembly factor-like uncharacterized protein